MPGAGRPKLEVKTILLQSCQKEWLYCCRAATTLLCTARVSGSALYFAHGIAAFSDFCGKKRNLQECLQETFSWVKFIQAELPAIAGLKEKIEKLPQLPLPGAGPAESCHGGKRTGSSAQRAFSAIEN